ncbi:peptide chain release factor N(5)-glutamine methyltransferase [Arachidicoccus soli]|uniref:Release factor glutamine methyltransferase n=1 Tax=Arachidicoccus soli TaxID=2341117 RepID=A0A386HMB4_9BACT|nr:peptide chain release factor N(5)-glutamine methyltransferase [Arachidicoccus soli]AYD46925.1 peptide chain release factor N(5)-glutamine methyltransferase [Arachidicoccus soli]
MTIHFAQSSLKDNLTTLYSVREAANIANLVLEKITKFSRIDRLINKDKELTSIQISLLERYTDQLLQNRPVQYVLGEAHFSGLTFFVNEKVLIPRPETEELVLWITENIGQNPYSVLDIGTGSGCIAVSLKNRMPNCKISALDISYEALNIAQQNAQDNDVEVDFLEADILNESTWNSFGEYNCIVSNPPYITKSEQELMNANVLNYEPHTALFVPNNEPLLFYERIALFAQQHLLKDGYLFFEINENLGLKTVRLLQEKGFKNIELKKDLQGKDRMVKCLFKK